MKEKLIVNGSLSTVVELLVHLLVALGFDLSLQCMGEYPLSFPNYEKKKTIENIN